jgi:hypothetical protein
MAPFIFMIEGFFKISSIFKGFVVKALKKDAGSKLKYGG